MAFEKLKEARRAAEQAKERHTLDVRLRDLQADAERAQEAFELTLLNWTLEPTHDVQLKKGEIAYLAMPGVALIEPRRGPSTWVGGSQGVSFKIAKGVRYRVGVTKGHVIQGEERPTPIDIGLGVVTSQRIVFIGSKRSTEWAYTKLLGYNLDLPNMAIFNVANRQKASGLGYAAEHDWAVDAIVSAAIAKFNSDPVVRVMIAVSSGRPSSVLPISMTVMRSDCASSFFKYSTYWV